MSITTSYIIITWNGKGHLQHLIESMQKQLERKDVEVIIVDNGSNDGTVDWLKTSYPQIQLILLEENKGVSYARNRALEKAQGKYLFIVDNDVEVNDEAISGMESYLDKHADVGIVGCRLLYPDGATQESCKPYPGLLQKLKHVFHFRSSVFTYEQQISEGKPFEPVYIIGACQMIRAKAYQQIGPLDEHIFYGPEDCDYCLRMKKAGWKVIYLPSFSLIHHCQRKTTTRPFSALGRIHMRALLYFYWKYKRL